MGQRGATDTGQCPCQFPNAPQLIFMRRACARPWAGGGCSCRTTTWCWRRGEAGPHACCTCASLSRSMPKEDGRRLHAVPSSAPSLGEAHWVHDLRSDLLCTLHPGGTQSWLPLHAPSLMSWPSQPAAHTTPTARCPRVRVPCLHEHQCFGWPLTRSRQCVEHGAC